MLRGQVVSVGLVSENDVTYLPPSTSGLYMYAMFLFRFMRPPLLIPWPEIQYESACRFLWLRSHRLRLAGGMTAIRVKDRALQQIRPFLSVVPDISPE